MPCQFAMSATSSNWKVSCLHIAWKYRQCLKLAVNWILMALYNMLSHALFLPALFSTLSQSSHSYDPELYPSLQSSKIYPNNLRSAQQSISVSNMWIKFDFFKQIIKNIYFCLAKSNSFSRAISWGVFWLYKSRITFVCSVVRITLRLLIVCVCVCLREGSELCYVFFSIAQRLFTSRLGLL